jgi:hypothetical protein
MARKDTAENPRFHPLADSNTEPTPVVDLFPTQELEISTAALDAAAPQVPPETMAELDEDERLLPVNWHEDRKSPDERTCT